ncbi:MAG: aspartyl protease family protein [Treponema sp.]|nr:aspartyl protease family protein [Treponema sp.]
MGLVYTEITLKNANDKMMAKKGYIKEEDIRSKTITAMVDTGAWTLVINEAVREELGLEILGKEPGDLADGQRVFLDMAGPLELWWKDRWFLMPALVAPNAKDILLGAIPLEALDLVVDPRNETLVGRHGEQVVHKV